uniref:Uncharacterized protein n=1 Tax=Onchocerca volvulus TaxID=6282 RepID=A0A8R1Y0P7_ONCVO
MLKSTQNTGYLLITALLRRLYDNQDRFSLFVSQVQIITVLLLLFLSSAHSHYCQSQKCLRILLHAFLVIISSHFFAITKGDEKEESLADFKKIVKDQQYIIYAGKANESEKYATKKNCIISEQKNFDAFPFDFLGCLRMRGVGLEWQNVSIIKDDEMIHS